MRPYKFVIEKQVSEFRSDNGLSLSEPIALKSLLLKLNILTIFRPLSENFSGMCLKDKSGHRFMLVNSNQSQGRQYFTIAHELYHLYIEENPTPHKCNPGNGSKDPVVEYKFAGFDMFNEMTASIREDTVRMLLHVKIEQKVEREEVAKVTGTNKDDSVKKGPVRRESAKIGRNDPCPCGSGKKYKMCCGRNL